MHLLPRLHDDDGAAVPELWWGTGPAASAGRIRMSLFIEWPLLAAIPGVAFLLVYWRSRRRLILCAAVAWLLYAVYELGMRWRILCSGECNIRVDLLLIYPALLALSLIAVVTAARRPGSPA
jgi:hypothetical protein